MNLAKKYHLYIIEDATEALGLAYKMNDETGVVKNKMMRRPHKRSFYINISTSMPRISSNFLTILIRSTS